MTDTMYWDIVNAYQSITVTWRAMFGAQGITGKYVRGVDCAIASRLVEVDKGYSVDRRYLLCLASAN